jgi:[protein-PII] uridylyltransferase
MQDRPAISAGPYFDTRQLRVELTAIAAAHGDDAGKARGAIVDHLKKLVKTARASAERQLASDGDGIRCAAGLSRFQDELTRLIFDYTIAHVYFISEPAQREEMSVVATGGYGRGLLAPGSDIDLLFLLASKQTAWGESVVEYMLYILWDLGFKVGHATRTVDQCLKFSQSDMTIRTALLDARFLFGSTEQFRALERRIRDEVIRTGGRAFIEAKLTERDQRHLRAGESRYKVEPNIKDGKGGLRDLHTLHWIAKSIYGAGPGDDTMPKDVFTPGERATFRRCEQFLWTIRCHLHFLTGRAEERLSFDVQPQLAARLGYADRGGLRGVERFMKHYFLVAKDVGDLTAILCAALELDQLKAPGFAELLNPLSWRTRRRVRMRTDFRIDNGRLNVADAHVFQRDPVNLIRIFAEAEHVGALFHPAAIRLIRASRTLIDEKLRRDVEANRTFVELLTAEVSAESILRRMNEAGVLGRFLPEFGKVVSMMQFNLYHHYTVDEHLIRTVGQIAAIEKGAAADNLPLSTEIIKTIQNRRALYVAAFLHDVGKGRNEDHSIAGARIAQKLCPRFGMGPAETETVVWLIEQHLTMSTVAQSRDLGDPKTIRAFADIVQSPERLKLLLLLTVADIRAVGPQTWNGWKGQLLRTLYYETEPLVAGGHTQAGTGERARRAESQFRSAAAGKVDGDVEAFIARQYPDYWLRTEPRQQIEHAQLVARAERSDLKLATDVRTDTFTAITEFTVYAPNHPRLLAIFAGACASAGANIVGAHIATTRDGFALDTFRLQREFDDDADERRRATRIADTIGKLLAGEAQLRRLVPKRREARPRAFQVPPEVIIDNALSDHFSVIEVAGLDRAGLLFQLTNALSDLNLDITSAHITTFGEKAVDVFYVTDLTNKKITAPQRQKAIRERLLAILTEEPDAAPRA